MRSGPPLVWGALGRDKPHSWLLLRARDGKTLASSDSSGGALKSAHSFWPKLDASDVRESGLRLLRDKTGALVGAVSHASRQADAAAELRGLLQPANPTPKAAPMTDTPKRPRKAAKAPARKAAPKPLAKAPADTASAPLHVILPRKLHDDIAHARENVEHATGIMPTTATVVRSALELGLRALADRVSR